MRNIAAEERGMDELHRQKVGTSDTSPIPEPNPTLTSIPPNRAREMRIHRTCKPCKLSAQVNRSRVVASRLRMMSNIVSRRILMLIGTALRSSLGSKLSLLE
ncbi:hypothetical protein HYDPIDRAFT_120191, partial [Hydnomerulius pinastri MD-312]